MRYKSGEEVQIGDVVESALFGTARQTKAGLHSSGKEYTVTEKRRGIELGEDYIYFASEGMTIERENGDGPESYNLVRRATQYTPGADPHYAGGETPEVGDVVRVRPGDDCVKLSDLKYNTEYTVSAANSRIVVGLFETGGDHYINRFELVRRASEPVKDCIVIQGEELDGMNYSRLMTQKDAENFAAEQVTTRPGQVCRVVRLVDVRRYESRLEVITTPPQD